MHLCYGLLTTDSRIMTLTNELKSALVTAGARRIGKSMALALAADGFTVAIHAHRSTREAEETVNQIKASGGKAAVVHADLTQAAEMDALVKQATDQIGPLDLVINNASAFLYDTVTNLDANAWAQHFALHVEAPSRIASAFAKQLPDDAAGLIINMIDQRVLKLDPRFYSYVLSKSALWTATRTMAQALAPRIRVNAIGLGPAMPSPRQKAADFKKQAASVLLRHGPELAEISDTVAYLYRAKSVTGQMIALDGGQHLAWKTPDILETGE